MFDFPENLFETIKDFISDSKNLSLIIVGAFLITIILTCFCLCCLLCCKKSAKTSSKLTSTHLRRPSSSPSLNYHHSHPSPPPPPPEPQLSRILETPSAPTPGQLHPNMINSLRHAQLLRAERLAAAQQGAQIMYYESGNQPENFWLVSTGSGHNQTNLRPSLVRWSDGENTPPPSYDEARAAAGKVEYPNIPAHDY